jgi:hypothetical protein
MRVPGMLTPASALVVLAKPAPVNWDPRLLFNSLWIIAILLVGALIIAVVAHWRRNSRGDQVSASEQLAHFRKLREEGKLSDEEFDALRAVLGGRIRKAIQEPKKDAIPPTGHQVVAENKPIEPPQPPNEGFRAADSEDKTT